MPKSPVGYQEVSHWIKRNDLQVLMAYQQTQPTRYTLILLESFQRDPTLLHQVLSYAMMNWLVEQLTTLCAPDQSFLSVLNLHQHTPLQAILNNIDLTHPEKEKIASYLIDTLDSAKLLVPQAPQALGLALTMNALGVFEKLLATLEKNNAHLKVLAKAPHASGSFLHLALKKQLIDKIFIEKLLFYGANMLAKNSEGYLPCEVAIQNKRLDIAVLLITNMCSPKQTLIVCQDSNTDPIICLRYAIRTEDIFLFSALISNVSRLNRAQFLEKDAHGLHLLDYAALQQQEDMLSCLKNKLTKKQLETWAPPPPSTPFKPLLVKKRILSRLPETQQKIIQLIQKDTLFENLPKLAKRYPFTLKNALFSARDENGNNLAHLTSIPFFEQLTALFRGLELDIQLLLKTPNTLGNTPLRSALLSDNFQKFECLLKQQGRIQMDDKNQQTLLHLAVFLKNWPAANLLLDYGASLTHPDENQKTPLHLVMKQDSLDCFIYAASLVLRAQGASQEALELFWGLDQEAQEPILVLSNYLIDTDILWENEETWLAQFRVVFPKLRFDHQANLIRKALEKAQKLKKPWLQQTLRILSSKPSSPPSSDLPPSTFGSPILWFSSPAPLEALEETPPSKKVKHTSFS